MAVYTECGSLDINFKKIKPRLKSQLRDAGALIYRVVSGCMKLSLGKR